MIQKEASSRRWTHELPGSRRKTNKAHAQPKRSTGRPGQRRAFRAGQAAGLPATQQVRPEVLEPAPLARVEREARSGGSECVHAPPRPPPALPVTLGQASDNAETRKTGRT